MVHLTNMCLPPDDLGKEEPEDVDPAHRLAVLEGLAQANRRDFASDADIEAAFRRFDP
jgi:hypothetical protein